MALVLGGLTLISGGVLCGVYALRERSRFARLKETLVQAVRDEAELALSTLISKESVEPSKTIAEDDEQEQQHDIQTIDDLPECVQNWVHHTIRDSRRFRVFTLTQQLQLRFAPDKPWIKAPGLNIASPLTPSFCFQGSATMNPAMWVEGYESLTGGKGSMLWQAYGFLPVASQQGELVDKAARVRWLLEAVCFPQALLPSTFLQWKPVVDKTTGKHNENEACAILSYQNVTVSAIFTFDTSRNNIIGVRSDDYAKAMPDGSVKKCGISGRCRGHMLFGLSPSPMDRLNDLLSGRNVERSTAGGVVVPAESEASFVDLETGEEEPYVRVLLTHLVAT